MKKTLPLLTLLFAISSFSFAQERYIARGATPGELYLSSTWYIIYDPNVGPPYLDSVHKAVFHITENGKKITIPYSVEIIRIFKLSILSKCFRWLKFVYCSWFIIGPAKINFWKSETSFFAFSAILSSNTSYFIFAIWLAGNWLTRYLSVSQVKR